MLDLIDVEDVRRPLGRLAVDKSRRLGLSIPGIVDASLDPGPAEPDRAGPRQPAEIRGVPGAEDEVIEPVRAGHEGVLELVGPMDDAVARAYLVHLLVLPREPGAREHEEDLLRGAVGVRRCRQLARGHLDPVHADALRTGGLPEPLPSGVHLALHASVGLDVVPVRDSHGRNLEAEAVDV